MRELGQGPTVPVPTRILRRIRRTLHRLAYGWDALADRVSRPVVLLVAGLGALGSAGVALSLLAGALLAGPGLGPLSLVAMVAALGLFVPTAGFLARMSVDLALPEGSVDPVLRGGKVRTEESRFELSRVHGRRALVVRVSFATDLLDAGDRVEVRMRLLDQGGRPVEARGTRLRGPRDEILVRELSGPVGENDDLSATLGLVVPLRDANLPEVHVPIRLTADLEFRIEGRLEGRHQLPIEYLPLSEDYPKAPEEKRAPRVLRVRAALEGAGVVEPAIEPGAIELVGPAEAPPDPECPVCGDPLAGEPRTGCPICDTPHHRECWRWNQRCTTYGCQGGTWLEVPDEARPSP